MKNNRTRRASERGNAMVESALILTVFLLLLIGIFDFGQFLFLHQAMTERVRLAARWGIVNDPTNTTAIRNMVLYGKAAPTESDPTYFGLNTSHVSVLNQGAGTDDYRLVVKISGYQYAMLSPTIKGSYTGPNITISMPLGQ